MKVKDLFETKTRVTDFIVKLWKDKENTLTIEDLDIIDLLYDAKYKDILENELLSFDIKVVEDRQITFNGESELHIVCKPILILNVKDWRE